MGRELSSDGRYWNDAFQSERISADYWQTRAMRAEAKLLNARNAIGPIIEFYANPRNWDEGDVPGHVYAHDDAGRMARKLVSDGWTAKGKAWLASGAIFERKLKMTDWNRSELRDMYQRVESMRSDVAQPVESPLDASLRDLLSAIEATDCEWAGITVA